MLIDKKMLIKKENIVLIGATMLIMTAAFFLFLRLSKTADKPLPPQIQPEALVEIKGIVGRYGANPEGNIDKIFITDGKNEYWIHFPPHTAKQVLSVAVLKASVSVTIQTRNKGLHDVLHGYELRTISTSDKVIDVTDIPPPPPAVGKLVEVSGNKVGYQKDENGNINAFILSGKLIMLPPHTRESLLPLLMTAGKVTVKGLQRDKNSGFINENAIDVVLPSVVIIDSVNYLVR